MRYFNTAGPCDREKHYMIDASTRLHGVEQLIDMEQYFVIHAARQSGKTTYLRELTDKLNAGRKYDALYCSLENLQGITDPEKGIPEIVRKIKNVLRYTDIPHKTEFAKDADYENFTDVLKMELTQFCLLLDKPLVLFFDEADCLSEGTLITFLRQLRNDTRERLGPANPIYGEVIARMLSYNSQQILEQGDNLYNIPRYLQGGQIDMDFLMRDFQRFWRENSAIWEDKYQYREAAPHLILMAFLQRVINGGGDIHREMAAGRGRTDLCLLYGDHKYPIELKIW